MPGFVDLHCHWIPGVDDGAPTLEEGVAMLRGLGDLGFETVVATPHMRPGLFDNDAVGLRQAFDQVEGELSAMERLPRRQLSCEHYFDDVVYARLLAGAGLPYPGERAVLLEFFDNGFPPSLDRLLSQLSRSGLVPVVAHPERYRPLWNNSEVLDRLLDLGAVALLDVAALVGKYGRRPQRCAEELLERGAYHAACSDAHRPADVETVAAGIDWVRQRYGDEEVQSLFSEGPREILGGTCHT
jgi:protein-tyrosine phosphatase